MPDNILETLYERFDEILAEIPDKFTSHQFILKLAQRYQREYIEVLYHYRESDIVR